MSDGSMGGAVDDNVNVETRSGRRPCVAGVRVPLRLNVQ